MNAGSFQQIIHALNDSQTKYLVVGGMAVASYGYNRWTKDLDLVVHLDEANLLRALRALAQLGYASPLPVPTEHFADRAKREQWITEKGMIVFNLKSDFHRDMPIDIFVREPFDFEKEYAVALQQELAPGVRVPVVALPALLQMKREAGRTQDLDDVRELTAIAKYEQSKRLLKEEDPWASARSFEANALEQRYDFKKLPLQQKVKALEAMEEIARQLRKEHPVNG